MKSSTIQIGGTARNPASLSAELAGLFPPGVAAAELRSPVGADLLLPEEALGCENFAPKRLAEFVAGRVCARRALSELGLDGFALRRGADRYPIWPEDIIGSITHTGGFCAAAVARRGPLQALGLDAERIAGVTAELWPQICTIGEMAWLAGLPEPVRNRAAAIVFSAKEAFYKCQYGIAGEWLEFHDIVVEVSESGMTAGELTLRPAHGGQFAALEHRRLAGRYRLEDDLVISGFALLTIEAVPRVGRSAEEGTA
jgi:4'-phosphopantetheinyl transferase EntD